MRSGKALLLVSSMAGLLVENGCYTPKSEGQRLYSLHCANCHMDDGAGLRNLIPPLANADYLQTHRDKLACLVKHGQNGEIVVNGVSFNGNMPANEDLSEVDITNILNYVQQNFGNQNKLFSPAEVNQALEKCKH